MTSGGCHTLASCGPLGMKHGPQLGTGLHSHITVLAPIGYLGESLVEPGHWWASRRVSSHLHLRPREAEPVSAPSQVQSAGRALGLSASFWPLVCLWSSIPGRPWAITPLPLISVSPSRWRGRLQGPLSGRVSRDAIHTGLPSLPALQASAPHHPELQLKQTAQGHPSPPPF